MWMTGALLWGMVLTIPSIVSSDALDTTDIPTEYDLDTTDIPFEYDLDDYDGGIEINDTDYFEMFDDENIFDNWNSTAERQVSVVDQWWRDDNRCGDQHPVTNGIYKGYPARCKGGPCCNAEGMCGDGDPWCKCAGCTDYRCLSTQANPFYETDTATGNCDYGKPNPTRIVGGDPVPYPRKYPWIVGIEIPNVNSYWCGGTIINNRWILTAAHCVIDVNSYPTCRTLHAPVHTLKIWVGDHNQKETIDNVADTKYYRVKNIIKHYSFCKYPFSQVKTSRSHAMYDFALLELTTSISFNVMIRPVFLPAVNAYKWYTHTKGMLIGWGKMEKGVIPDILREVEVPIYDYPTHRLKCGIRGFQPIEKICSGKSMKAFCSGDSGGPLIVKDNGKYVQVGVMSYGPCNGNSPSVSGRVSGVLPWIKKYAGYYNKAK